MRKNRFKIVRIPFGEDTPCKECDVFWENGKHCTGNCQLIRRWKETDDAQIKGYIYKKIKK